MAQFFEMLKHLAAPYRTMVMVAQCTGPRTSEILGLQWGDFDFEANTYMVQRSSVGGRIDAVKAEYSRTMFRRICVWKNCCFGGGA